VDQLTHAVITITLVRATASLGKDIIKETIMHLIKRWIDNHNTRHNAEIEAGKTEPIIYNSFGQTISLKKDKS